MSQPNDPSLSYPTPPSFPGPKKTAAAGRFRFSRVFGRWWWLASLAIVAVTILVSLIPGWLDVRDPLYESTALIEVKPIMDVDPLTRSAGAPPMNRQFFNTQFEIIIAPETLKLALQKNDLLNRLGGDEREAIRRMQKSIRTQQRRGTDLISISYRDEDKELALDACTAVYEAYRDRRTELEMDMRRQQLKAIKVELINKQDRVAELRKRLMDISEKAGVTWVENGKDGQTIVPEIKLRQLAEKQLYEAERERDQLKFQINKMLALEDDDLIPLAAELHEVGFKEVYNKYEQAKRDLEKLKKSGLAEAHPNVKLHREKVDKLEKSLKKRAVNVRESLKHRLVLIETRIKKMRETRDRKQDEGTSRARSFQEFNIARKDYETAQGIKDQMQVKYDVEKVKLAIPPMNIIVHQIPEMNPSPVTKGKDFVTIIGTTASLPFSLIGGIILMYIAEAVFPRKR